MEQTRALVLHGARDLRLERRALRPLGDGDVRVRVLFSTLCGSDLKLVRGEFGAPHPLVPGHEIVGEVVEAGREWAHMVGRRVVPEIMYPCGTCHYCARTLPNLCSDLQEHGFTMDGGWADFLVGSGDKMHLVPDNLDARAASLLEPLAVALYALERVPVHAGDRVAILGAGGIGQLVAQAVRAAGVAEILIADRVPARLRIAEELAGAQTTDDLGELVRRNPLLAPDVVFECAGSPHGLSQAVELVRPAGRVGLIGFSSERAAPVDANTVILKLLDIKGILSPTGTWARAVELAAAGRVKLAPLVTHVVPVTDFGRALRLAEDKDDGAVRVALDLA